MLIIIIVWLRYCPCFLRTFSSYQNFASGLFFKTLLVKTFWSDNHTNVVHTIVLFQVDLFLKLICFVYSFKGVVRFRISIVVVDLRTQDVALFSKHYLKSITFSDILTLFGNLGFVSIGPFVSVSSLNWRFTRDHNIIACCSCFFPIFLQLDQIRIVDFPV